MGYYVAPESVRTPGQCVLNRLDNFTRLRMTAWLAEKDDMQDGYLGQVFEIALPETSANIYIPELGVTASYASPGVIYIPLTVAVFNHLNAQINKALSLHFSGKIKSGDAAGMWTSIPQGRDPEKITLTAGEDCTPEIIGGSWTLVQPQSYGLATSQPLAGITSMEISCRVVQYSNTGNPTVTGQFNGKTVSFSYVRDDGTYTRQVLPVNGNPDGNTYPVKLYKATAGPLVAPTTEVLVTATEVGGLRSAEYSFKQNNVVNYEKPVLSIGACFRCTAGGQAKDGGPYAEVYVTLNCDTNASGNGVKKLTVKLNGTTYNLTSGQTSIIGGSLSENTKYTAVFVGQDLVGSEVTREVILPGALKDFVVLRGSDNQGSHVGVGMTPAITTGKSSIELPLGGSFLLDDLEYGAYELLAGSPRFGTDFLNVDLLDAKAPQNAACYIAVNGSDWGTYTNGPSAVMNNNFSCLRKVIPCTRYTCIVILLETYPVRGRMWVNIYSSGAFTGWKSLTPT